MFKRISQLSFIIGLFFVIVSLILIGGYFFLDALKYRVNLYSGLCFLLFGVFMVMLKTGERDA